MPLLSALTRLSSCCSRAVSASGLRGVLSTRPSPALAAGTCRAPPSRSRQFVPTRALLKPAEGWKPTWSQTATEVTISLPVEESIHKQDVKLEVHTKRLELRIGDETVLEGQYGEDSESSFGQRVDPDGCFWSFESDTEAGRVLQVTLEKKMMGHDSWEKLFPDDGPDMAFTDFVYMDVRAGERELGRLVLGLHGNVAPITVRNFVELCTGFKAPQEEGNEEGEGKELTFRGSPFHRIIPRFMAQGGDITMGNGTGGVSIYGGKFDDENFVLKHDQAGILSMANAGPNTNGSQFFILFEPQPHLDGKHTVFGRVVDNDSMKVLRKMEDLGTKSGAPKDAVYISECGLLEDAEEKGPPIEMLDVDVQMEMEREVKKEMERAAKEEKKKL
eukprot:CAMPEP_0117678222 /NCGR_PEP_ID=MMETSP0804-20121206/17181_1 /TAXON_ID=1074897 /ORGANISM="Tetraselmis astigmatica, Strain CCMP880" /LENGTH=387 /DNA_ID=CAMNT_0005487593 /DNA_START=27 /DNA_END=1190 /DNA_ORIENTATION=+